MEMLEGNQMGSNNTFFQETVTQKLKKELIRNTQFPDTVINILQNDLEDKEKQKMIEQAKMAKQYNKINQKKLTLIRKEFMTAHGRERQIKVLDAMLGHVKFLAKYSEEQRHLVFRKCDYLVLPGRTTIFKQGDHGDKMYIIIKGRVVVEKKSEEYGNLPLNVCMLYEGDHFGELGLID